MQAWHRNEVFQRIWNEIRTSSKVWIQHPKDNDGNHMGTLVSFVYDGVTYAGASLVHPNDMFNRKLGRMIALGRAKKLLAWDNFEEITCFDHRVPHTVAMHEGEGWRPHLVRGNDGRTRIEFTKIEEPATT